MRALAPAASLLALAGCQLLSYGVDRFEVRTSLPAPQAAWVAAQTCREAFPGADPAPRQPGAPALRDGPDALVIRYGRAPGDAFRVAMDGRLVPGPAADGAALPRVELAPQPRSRTRHAVRDRAVLRITRSARGSHVTVELAGVARTREVAARLRANLALAEAVSAASARLRAGDVDGAAAVAEDARACLPDTTLTTLRARITLQQARAEAARGDLPRARDLTTSALADDAGLDPARTLREELDRRLGRSASSEVAVEPPGAGDRAGTLADLLAVAHTHEARGELEAAARWLLAATVHPDHGPDELLELARVYGRLGEHRRAYETRLLALELGGSRPELRLALHDDCLRMGDAARALRWVACHSDRALDAPSRQRAEVSAVLAGPRLARGVLHTRHGERALTALPLTPPGQPGWDQIAPLRAGEPGDEGVSASPAGFPAQPR